MTFFSVVTPIHHTEVAPSASTGVAPVTVSNYLGGALILTLLAVMVATGLAAARMEPRMTKQFKLGSVNPSYPVRSYKQ